MPQVSSEFEGNARRSERRAHPRQPVRSLAYVELGEGNGGIVLNISELGMAVQAVMSLAGRELPDLRVQLAHAKKQIETKGHVAWTDEFRKLAGIEFVDLSEEARAQIREWISLECPELEPAGKAESSSSVEKITDRTAPLPEAAPQPAALGARPETRDPLVDSAWAKSSMSAAPDKGGRAVVEPAAEPPPAFAPASPTPDPVAPAAMRSRAMGSSIRAALSVPAEAVEQTDAPRNEIAAPDGRALTVGVRSASSSQAPFSAPAADLPPDRFGFKPAALGPGPQGETGAENERLKLAVLVGIFLLVSLGVGWMARRGTFEGARQPLGGGRNQGSGSAFVDHVGERPAGGSLPTSQIEVVDLDNQRWLIPMQAPASNPHRSASLAVHSPRMAAETEATPASVTSSSQSSEGSLPRPDASSDNKPRDGISAPLQSVSAEDTGLQPGELVQKVEPAYPPAALAQKVEGTVKIFAAIDAQGNIKTLEPLSGPRLLIPAALDAVRQWHYGPTLLNGRPIETQRQIMVVFHMATNP